MTDPRCSRTSGTHFDNSGAGRHLRPLPYSRSRLAWASMQSPSASSTASCSRVRGRCTADAGRVLLTPGGDEGGYGSLPDFQRYREGTRGTLDLAAEGRSSLTWRAGAETRTAWVLFVSPNYFSMVRPGLGRGQARCRQGRRRSGDGRHRRAVLAGVARVGAACGPDPASEQPRRRGRWSHRRVVHGPGRPLLPGRLAAARRPRAIRHGGPFARARYEMALSVWSVGGRRDACGRAGAVGRGHVATSRASGRNPTAHRGARFRMFSAGNSELRGLATAAAIGMA